MVSQRTEQTGLPEPLQKILAEFDIHRQQLIDLKDVWPVAQAMQQEIPGVYCLRINKASPGLFAPAVVIEITCESRSDVVVALRWLGRHGFHQTERPIESGDLKTRTYFMGPINLSVAFGEHSTCRFVKVGERTEPVYEMQCT